MTSFVCKVMLIEELEPGTQFALLLSSLNSRERNVIYTYIFIL